MRSLTGRHLHTGALRVCAVVGFGVGVCLVCQGLLVVGGRSVIVGMVSRQTKVGGIPKFSVSVTGGLLTRLLFINGRP